MHRPVVPAGGDRSRIAVTLIVVGVLIFLGYYLRQAGVTLHMLH